MAYTTLNKIKEYNPCPDGWGKLLKHLGKSKADDKRLYFKTILKSNGIQDAVWALRTLTFEDRCLFQADVAESVLHIFEKKYPDDKRPRKAIEAVRNYKAKGISLDELRGKKRDADAAAYAAYDAAAYAADAADAAADADADADDATAYAAAAAAYAAARRKKWIEIEQLFIKHFC